MFFLYIFVFFNKPRGSGALGALGVDSTDNALYVQLTDLDPSIVPMTLSIGSHHVTITDDTGATYGWGSNGGVSEALFYSSKFKRASMGRQLSPQTKPPSLFPLAFSISSQQSPLSL